MRSFAATWADWSTATVALTLLLSTAVGLVGCGRKSGLDPPPLATPVQVQPPPAPPDDPRGPAMVPGPPAR